jgi:phosphinothricin acetyltransferase
VLGFAALSPFRDRPAYATTVENSVYVDRSARGLGVGRALLEAIIAAAKEQGFHSIIARISGDNGLSVTLHETLGFTVVGIEREVGRKHGTWLDVIELQLLVD